MKKIILIAMAIVVALGLMSFTASDEHRPDFGDSKAVYSGPCGNYSVDVNTLTKMYYMLPANIRKDIDKAYAQSDGLYRNCCYTMYGVTLKCVDVGYEGNWYDFIITYQDHTIKVNHIHMQSVWDLFNWVPLG
jgi:hypothetical protein